ncbi:ribosome biogenesis GTP-binding protein YihA/YsxC [Panacagrimonas sp.]|uniref:ribosome biogenesis GTP-binding protein YihA/YsxC n=1 Tax=Panacagrimonas sp. TaxID=2480088 RepID=UPI003B52F72F
MLNPFAQAQFVMSCAELAQCPRDGRPELAFSGRSNSGKSSALNALCGHKGLARVSKTPGRTQLINLFELPTGERLVDLPGYGYAKVPGRVRQDWARMVGTYVEQRTSLQGIVLIMDCRHPLTDHDRQMLEWVRNGQRPCHILLSKSDKLGFGAGKNTFLKVRRDLQAMGVSAGVQLFSAQTGQGLDEARAALWKLLPSAAGLAIEIAPSL